MSIFLSVMLDIRVRLASSLERNTATVPQKTSKDPYQQEKEEVNGSWSVQGYWQAPYKATALLHI